MRSGYSQDSLVQEQEQQPTTTTTNNNQQPTTNNQQQQAQAQAQADQEINITYPKTTTNPATSSDLPVYFNILSNHGTALAALCPWGVGLRPTTLLIDRHVAWPNRPV